jgi:hypothetical protein
LVDDELRESLIMGKVVQHLAESSDKGKELRSALEDGLLRMSRPVRVLVE